MYFADRKWLKWHKDDPEFKAFKGQKITQFHDENCKKELIEDCQKHNIKMLESIDASGLSESPDFIHQGSNSGYQAINLAYLMGAKKIILLGYDMQFTDGKAHWFGEHPDEIRSGYDGFIKKFNKMAEHMPKGLEIINCTRKTALNCFPIKKLEEVL